MDEPGQNLNEEDGHVGEGIAGPGEEVEFVFGIPLGFRIIQSQSSCCQQGSVPEFQETSYRSCVKSKEKNKGGHRGNKETRGVMRENLTEGIFAGRAEKCVNGISRVCRIVNGLHCFPHPVHTGAI